MTQTLVASIRHDVLLERTDTRTVAKSWIEANIPSGAKIAIDWPTHGPPLKSNEDVQFESQSSYEINLVGGSGLSEHTLTWYHDNEYEYLITSSFIYQIPLVFPELDEERRAFYDSLKTQLKVVQTFRPTDNANDPDFVFDEIYGPLVSLWGRDQPGPTLLIYELN